MPAVSIFTVPGGNPQAPGPGEVTVAFDTTEKTLKAFDGTTLFRVASDQSASGAVAGVGAVAGTTATVAEVASGPVHQTTITFTAIPMTIPNAVAANQASGVKIYDFPEGRILILGVTATVAETTTSAILTTLNG